MSVEEFCERYGPGRTKAYEELKAGRLRGRKMGARTIITEDDAEDWLQQLPVIETKIEQPPERLPGARERRRPTPR
jgi:hypothetical protein